MIINNSIETYKVFADLYDLYVGKFDADFDFYKSYCKKSDKIIEIGCGTGRILNYLLSLGCKVTGVDISQDMLGKAYKKLNKWINTGDLSLINHDFASGKINDRFNIALLTFYTFNYILDSQVVFVRNILDSLVDNGHILMDLFYPNTLYDKSINGKWINKEYILDGLEIKIRDNRTMIGDIEYRQQIFNINNKETKIDTIRKYYSPRVVRDVFESAGFMKVEFSYGYDNNGFSGMIDESKLNNNYIVKAKK